MKRTCFAGDDEVGISGVFKTAFILYRQVTMFWSPMMVGRGLNFRKKSIDLIIFTKDIINYY